VKVRLRDLAEGLGLSVMAVSKALRDAPDIGAATKAKVHAEAQRLGYWPNEAARSLRVKQSGWVGFILPDLASEEAALISGGLTEAAQEAGIAILLGLARTGKEEAEQVRAMIGRGAEAIFLLPRISTEHRSAALEVANRSNCPMIFLKRYPADVGLGSGKVSWVVRDMKGAADVVLDHLHDLGHRRVAYLGGHSAARSHALHMQSVLEGVEKRGMALVGGAQMVGLEPEDAERELKKILGKKDGPTAVICGTDTLAQGVFRACFRAGVEIPKGMSVTGVGDGELSRQGMVPLTTVRFPGLGKVGFALWKKMRDGVGGIQPEVVQGELVVRESTGKA